MSDPKRLLDDLRGGELESLLAAGKSELPDDAQLIALAAKIGVAGAIGGIGGTGAAGAGGGAGAGAGAAVKGGVALKIGIAVAVVSAAGAGTVAVTSQRASVVASTPTGIVATASVSATATSEGSVSLPPRVDPVGSVEPSANSAPSRPSVAKRAAPNPADEVKLLERAQDALKSSRPDEALASCNEHAKRYPNGLLTQEREVIAVEALVKTGRTAEAKSRAEKFKARFPGSSHARRIDAIVGP